MMVEPIHGGVNGIQTPLNYAQLFRIIETGTVNCHSAVGHLTPGALAFLRLLRFSLTVFTYIIGRQK